MARSEGGFICLLREGHTGPHQSVDNQRKDDRGYPGMPIRWDRPSPTYGDAIVKAIQERTGGTLPLAQPGYTGIPCDSCGGVNTRRTGTCLTCDDCHSSGGCG